MGDEYVQAVRCTNLGLHLVVATSQMDVVAICMHPLGLRAAEQSHKMFADEQVVVVAPDTAVSVNVPLVGHFRQASYRAAVEAGCRSQLAIAKRLGVCERTVRNWIKAGVVT